MLLATPNAENLPAVINSEEELDEVLTRPRGVLVDFIRTVSSPLVIVGAGGKMGPTLAVLARRAAKEAGHPLEIVAVSRFSNNAAREWLESCGVNTITADLLQREDCRRLPDAANVLYTVGLKFGTTNDPSATWAANTLIPATVAERYADARIVAMSTGNVYPLVPVQSGGATETTPLIPPGEYANACVARERIFEYFSRRNDTPIVRLRLNYALELRYGVLLDIASKVNCGQPVDVAMGWFNCIWQGDANEMILRSLSLTESPAAALNLTSPRPFSVREVAARFGDLLGKKPVFTGHESDTALLNNPARLCSLLGPPPTPLDTIMRWTAHWLQCNGRTLNRPTHFEVRDGKF